MSSAPETAAVQTRETYEAEMRANFPWNRPLGIIQGMLLYLETGLHDPGVVVPSFLYAITGSNMFVGLSSTINMFANSLPQLFGVSLVEHLSLKKPIMLKFGFVSAACWAAIGAATFLIPKGSLFYAFLALQGIASAFMGLYLLVWTDVMSKVIPVENRGHYFGIRNFMATLATAVGVTIAGYLLARFDYPTNYSLAFLGGSLFFALSLVVLSLTREPVAWRVSEKQSTWQKLKQMPQIFGQDPNFFKFCCLRAMGAGFSMMAGPFYILFATQRLAGADVGALVGFLGTTTAITRSIGNLFWGAVAQKRGYKAPMELAFSIYAIAAVTAVFSRSFFMFVLVFIINGFGGAGLMMATHNIMMEFGQIQTRTTYIGISTVISGIVGGFAPLIGGFMADHFSYQTVFLATAAICLASSLGMSKLVVDPRHVQEYKE